MENPEIKDETKPIAIIGNIQAVEKNSKPMLKSANSIFYESFYFQDYYDDGLIKKFIKSTERLVRQSNEYTQYIAMVKTNYAMMGFDNVLSNIDSSDAEIEFHHYPFTLYDIIDIIMSYHLAKQDNFTSFSIAKEVMDLHFQQKIGIVPLSHTNHELAHAGALFISTKQIFGRWDEFAEQYKEGLSQEQKDKIKTLVSMSQAHAATDFKSLFDDTAGGK
jgi:hypothetical protein